MAKKSFPTTTYGQISGVRARKLPEPLQDSFNLSVILSALADPVRRHLLRESFLHDGPLECADAGRDIGLSPATLSHHWRVLREAGLTRTIVHGRSRSIEVRKSEMDEVYPGLLDAVFRVPNDSRSSFVSLPTGTDALEGEQDGKTRERKQS